MQIRFSAHDSSLRFIAKSQLRNLELSPLQEKQKQIKGLVLEQVGQIALQFAARTRVEKREFLERSPHSDYYGKSQKVVSL